MAISFARHQFPFRGLPVFVRGQPRITVDRWGQIERRGGRRSISGRFELFGEPSPNDCYLRFLRLQPKTAFSRFPPVHMAIRKAR